MTRGLTWKQGGPGLYWAELGDGQRAWVRREGREWMATCLGRAQATPTLWRAKAWAEGQRRRVA